VADCAYGDNVNFEAGLWDAGLPYVVSLKPSKGTWAMADQAHTPEEAARRLGWRGPAHPGDWTPAERRFRNGHMQTWYAANLEETVRLYGLRNWLEQGYKQVKQELAGQTLWCAAIERSAATGTWSAVPFRSAGRPGSRRRPRPPVTWTHLAKARLRRS
jgi:hypothetical protein